jgi:hypothetical protein
MNKSLNLLTLILPLLIGYLIVDYESENDDWIYIFDGESLDGWEGDPEYWRVEDEKIVGEVTAENLLDRNSFLIWRDGIVKDFELKVEYRVSDRGNSGINYRSQEVNVAGRKGAELTPWSFWEDPDDYIGGAPYALIGYQADIIGYQTDKEIPGVDTGMNYEERRRTTLAVRGEKALLPSISDANQRDKYISRNQWSARIIQESFGDSDSLFKHINEGWNEYHIIAKGNHLKHYVNGVLMSYTIDEDPINSRLEGLLGVQVHVGPPMKIEYRNFRIRHLE